MLVAVQVYLTLTALKLYCQFRKMDTKKIVCKLMIIMVLLLTIVNNMNADAQVADNRLFHNPGLGFDNTLSGEAMPSEQIIVYVDFNVLKGEDGYVPILLLELFGQSFQVEQTRVDERGLTDYAWCGKAKDGSISNVVLYY